MKIVACILSFIMGFCIAYMWIVPYSNTTTTEENTETTLQTNEENTNTKVNKAETKAYEAIDGLSGGWTLNDNDQSTLVFDMGTYSLQLNVGYFNIVAGSEVSNPIIGYQDNIVLIYLPLFTYSNQDYYATIYSTYSTTLEEGQIEEIYNNDTYWEIQILEDRYSATDTVHQWGWTYTGLFTWEDTTKDRTDEEAGTTELNVVRQYDKWVQLNAIKKVYSQNYYGASVVITWTTPEIAETLNDRWSMSYENLNESGISTGLTTINQASGVIWIGATTLLEQIKWGYSSYTIYAQLMDDDTIRIKITNDYGYQNKIIGNYNVNEANVTYSPIATDLSNYRGTVYIEQITNPFYINGTKIEAVKSPSEGIKYSGAQIVITWDSTTTTETDDVTDTVEPLVSALSTILTTDIFGDYGGLGTIALIMILITLGAGIIKLWIGGV